MESSKAKATFIIELSPEDRALLQRIGDLLEQTRKSAGKEYGTFGDPPRKRLAESMGDVE